MSILHSKPALPEHCSADDRTLAKSGDSRGKTSGGIVPDNTVGSSENPYVRSRTYLATQPAQERNISFHRGSELPGIGCNRNKSLGHSSAGRPGAPPLLVQCDDCHGAGLVTNGHPNDPWARSWCCSMCDGTGEVTAGCECCREDATEFWGGLYLCTAHAAEQRADALL